MIKKYVCISVSLLISLFIYLFYRTEHTVVNDLFMKWFTTSYRELRVYIQTVMPLDDYIVYSLPEGLWVYSITLTSKDLFVSLGKNIISLRYIPLVFAIGLELMQWLHFTNGRFDYWDIIFSVAFWAFAMYITPFHEKKQNMISTFNMRTGICIASYAIVYLAHVWTT